MYFIWGLSFNMYIMALSFTKLFHPALPSLTGRATLAQARPWPGFYWSDPWFGLDSPYLDYLPAKFGLA